MNSFFKIFAFIDNLKLRPKMFLITFIVFIGFGVSSVTGIFMVNKVKIGGRLYEKIKNKRDSLENIALLKSDLNRVRAETTALIGETDRRTIEQANNFLEELIVEVEKKFESINRLMDTEQKRQAVKDARATWEEFMGTMTGETMSAIERKDEKTARKLMLGIQKNRYERFIDRLEELVYTVKIEIEVLEASTSADANKMAVSTLILTLFLFLAVLGVTYLISKSTSERIISLNSMTRELAEGDLSSTGGGDGKVTGKDEIAELRSATDKMADNLKNMLLKVKVTTDNLSDFLEKLISVSGEVINGSDRQRDMVEQAARLIGESDNSISAVVMGAENLSRSSEDVSSAILEMTASIRQVAETSNVFSVSAEDVSSSINEMAASMKEIGESIERLSASFQQTTSSVTEINATVKEIEQNAGESVRLAEHVTDVSKEKGVAAVNASIKGMEDIKKIVETMTAVIKRLGNRSQEIGKIVNVIEEIADQTNLLALNAAIIAASADSEHSKAFAVVADEIKNLSGRTGASTKEIAELIQAVQKETSSGMQLTEEGLRSVDSGVKLAKEVKHALQTILDSSLSSTEKAKDIQRATVEESSVIKQITEAIQTMSEQIGLISRATHEQNKGSSLIMESVDRIRDLSNQVKNATKDQASGSRQISEVMQNVSQQATEIVGATSKQRQITENLVIEMENVKTIAEESVKISSQMGEAILQLGEEALSLANEMRKFKL